MQIHSKFKIAKSCRGHISARLEFSMETMSRPPQWVRIEWCKFSVWAKNARRNWLCFCDKKKRILVFIFYFWLHITEGSHYKRGRKWELKPTQKNSKFIIFDETSFKMLYRRSLQFAFFGGREKPWIIKSVNYKVYWNQHKIGYFWWFSP